MYIFISHILLHSVFGVLAEIVDIGARKDKCILSGILYSVAMMTVFFGGHFDMVLIGRIIYGAASALHHSSFESYVINEVNLNDHIC
jgi:hypothetical protein